MSPEVRFFSLALVLAFAPPLDETLRHIRLNVRRFENQVPDFLCQEKITSRTFSESDGTLRKETVLLSTFSGRQNRARAGVPDGTTFTEDRTIEKVNGLPWKRKAFPVDVFRLGGAYTSALITIFGRSGANNFSYALPVTEKTGPGGAIPLSFATSNDSQRIILKDGSHVYHESGTVWLDADSFEVVRLESRIVPQGTAFGEFSLAVDYSPFRIGEDTFRLPSHVSAAGHHQVSGNLQRGVYEAEYTNCRSTARLARSCFQTRRSSVVEIPPLRCPPDRVSQRYRHS
jgi:hypothetical protein